MRQERKKDLRLSCIVREYLLHCEVEKRLNPTTLRAYQVDLLQMIEYLGDIPITKLSKEQIRLYLQRISHYQHKTIKRKIASIKAMLNYYEIENECYVNPMRKMQIKMRDPIRLPTVMSLDEVSKVLETLYNQRNSSHSTPYTSYMAIRNIAIIEMLFATGMRVSELCDLKTDDVDIIHGRVRVVGKGDKERIIDICQSQTIKALKEWIAVRKPDNSDSPFFISRIHGKLSTQSVRLLVSNLISNIGISKHITPHTFRHTFATLLLEEDVDITYIQSLLGHSSITTTQIYTHVNLHKQREILKKKHPRRLI